MDIPSQAQAVRDGQRHAIARAITLVENEGSFAAQMLAALYPGAGHAYRIGVTGPPGGGKSTVVNALAKVMRQRDLTVAIVAVDPTSPFSGGAILGDRVRMNDLSGDAGIFIRSMATRGNLGGLASATSDVAEVLDAAGFDMLVIETVGAGQSEVDVASAAHTTIVIEAPGLGDDVQAIKAGILEIADVLVVNKADHPQADNAIRALRTIFNLSAPHPAAAGHHGPLATLSGDNDNQAHPSSASDWEVPILKTIATTGEGIPELLEAILAHKNHLQSSGELMLRDRARVAADLENRVGGALLTLLWEQVGAERIAQTIDALLARQIDPHTAAEGLVQHLLGVT